ncbi:MAG: 50S ribosomal protein L1 [Candidatus ainarchaeum sp.]|nr:50S ribosomal protein L1 [Candidatus ainarchaeum sp.]
MDKKKIKEALEKAFEDKGKRKFTQSVELIINFKGVNFSKAENRMNLDIFLPKGKGGKEPKVAIFADKNTGAVYNKYGVDLIIKPEEIASYSETAKMKELVNYNMFAQPNLMALVAKNLGQHLGRIGKMPKPLVGNPEEIVKKARSSVRLVSKGKYLPVMQAFIGTEKMSVDDLADNAESIYDSIKKKIADHNFSSSYVKLTMGKAVKI